MKLKSLHVTAITILLIFGGIALTSALGLWKTTNDKVPATYKDGLFVGQYDPADIRGSYTFDDIFNAFEIPIEDLGKAFGVQDPAKLASFQCKELESIYAPLAAEGTEVGSDSVRYFVALYKGLPFKVEEGTYLPKPAVEVLKEKASLTEVQLKSIEKYSVVLPVLSEAASVSATLPEKTVTERVIKGSTTFQELIDWGVTKEAIEKIINNKLPDGGKTVKDYATAKGIEFSTLKEPLQQLVDTASS